MPRLLPSPTVVLVAALALTSCTEATSPTGEAAPRPTGETSAEGEGTAAAGPDGRAITIDGDDALVWGDGPYGVVLAHGAVFDAASWAEQATAIAEQDATVVAVENIDPEAIRAAVGFLQDDGIEDVALVGGSAGADAVLTLAAREPELADQLILLSPNRTVEGLGTQPKLFVASEGEPVADVSTELADSAPGEDNEALLLPGSAHAQHIFDTDQGEPALDAVLERIERFSGD